MQPDETPPGSRVVLGLAGQTNTGGQAPIVSLHKVLSKILFSARITPWAWWVPNAPHLYARVRAPVRAWWAQIHGRLSFSLPDLTLGLHRVLICAGFGLVGSGGDSRKTLEYLKCK